MLTTDRKKTFRRIFSYKCGCRKKTLSDFLASRSSPWETVNTGAGKPAYKASRRDSAPTGSACGIVLYYMRTPVFPRVCDYRIHLVVRAIPLTLKLLEFLRCDVPVSSTLAWWQRLLIHVSESLRTVSLIQATTSLPILWSIE